jgi:hypothetical protein
MVPVVLVLGGLLEFARSPGALLHPQLFAEDGADWFAGAYNYGWFVPLSHAHAGYLQTLPRLVADVGLLVPLTRVPLLFALVALVVQVLPAVLVASRRFGTVVPDLRVRLLLAVVYLLVPNSSEVNINVTNAQWHLAVLAVLIVLAAPAGIGWRVFDVVVLVIFGLTGPFVVCLLPVAALWYWQRRQRWTLVLGVVTVVTSIIQGITLVTSTRGHEGPLGMSAGVLARILGTRIVGDTVLGSAVTSSHAYLAHLTGYSWLLTVAGVAVVVAAVWWGPLELKLFNLYAALVLGASLASPVASLTKPQWPHLAIAVGVRYWFLPTLALLVDLVWLAAQLRPGRRVAAAVAAVAVAVVVVTAGLAVRTDFSEPWAAGPDWTGQVARFEAVPAGHLFVFQIVPAGWTMTLVKK